MLNAVGREIPEEILERTGKEVFQGNNYKDGKAFQKASPKVTPVMRNDHDKMVRDIHEALVKCNAHDGMTVSFHHHFREGDLVVCMVMEEIHKMGFKNITLSASSLGKAHDALVPMIEDGTIVNIESSGVRGKIGDAIVDGLLGAISAVLKLIFKLFTTILGWIIWLVSQVLTLFPFLPPGLGALLIGGVVVCFIIGLIKFIRG